MSILSARYLVDDEFIREFNVRQIDSQVYNSTLKGHLYCPTPDCPSRVIYVNGLRPILKTWYKDDHHPNCLHAFERVKGRVGIDTTQFIDVELSSERKKRALKDALAQYNMTEEEQEQQRLKRTAKKSNPTTIVRQSGPSANLVLTNGEEVAGGGNTGFRGPNLRKRTPDMLKEVDEDQPRLIMGIVKDVKLIESTAEVVVIEKGIETYVKFEEVFHANSPTYAGLFHLIKRYKSEMKRVVFTGIGQVRLSTAKTHYELSVFNGEDFEVNGMILTTLAAYYRGA